jgi:hypothetical protein
MLCKIRIVRIDLVMQLTQDRWGSRAEQHSFSLNLILEVLGELEHEGLVESEWLKTEDDPRWRMLFRLKREPEV